MSNYDPNSREALIDKMFFQIDKNKDFNLTKDEFIDFYTNHSDLRERKTEEQAIKLFEDSLPTVNLNGDDKISYGEFWRNLCADQDISKNTMKMLVNDKMVDEFFGMYDLNKDGVVTQSEIAEVDNSRDQEQNNNNVPENNDNTPEPSENDNPDNSADDNQEKTNNNTEKNNNATSKGLSTGAIIGIVVGAITLVGIIIAVVVMLSKKQKSQYKNIHNQVQENLKSNQVSESHTVQ